VSNKFEDAQSCVVSVCRDDGGRGSGFIIKEDGLIVTARHVVRDSARVFVTLDNGQVYISEYVVVNESVDLDIALIKIPAKNLPYVKIANSRPELGDTVFAIGNPNGIGFNYLSGGIVSYVNVTIEYSNIKNDCPMFMFDSFVAPGSSGGPVFNDKLEVIGMVVATYPSSDSLNIALYFYGLQGVIDSLN
jgi:serine protease Do